MVERRGHDSELRPQIEDVPVVAAEHANRRRPVRPRQRPLFVRQQPYQNRLAGAVRSDDGGVLAFVDPQADSIEYRTIVLEDRGVSQLEDRGDGQ